MIEEKNMNVRSAKNHRVSLEPYKGKKLIDVMSTKEGYDWVCHRLREMNVLSSYIIFFDKKAMETVRDWMVRVGEVPES